jgi:hypothetical protein
MSTYTDIRYDYNLPSGYGGSLNLISEQTASASSSISFTSGIDSTYRTYMFKFITLHPSDTYPYLTFQASTDGGSNYNTTCTSTIFSAYHGESASGGVLGYNDSRDVAQSTSYVPIQVNGLTGNHTDDNSSGELYLFNPSSTTYVKHFIGRQASNMNTTETHIEDNYVAGYFNTTSAVNAINFKFSAGNIDAGTIKMYGIA